MPYIVALYITHMYVEPSATLGLAGHLLSALLATYT